MFHLVSFFLDPGGWTGLQGLEKIPRPTPSLRESAVWLAEDNWCVCEQACSPGRPDISQRPALLLLKPEQDSIFISLKQQWFCFKCVCVGALCVLTQSCPTRWPHGLWPAGLLCLWGSPGKSTGVGGHFPPPGDLPDPGMDISSPGAILAGGFFTTVPPGKPHMHMCVYILFQILFHYRLL